MVRVRFGGAEIRVLDFVTYGDIEAWKDLELLEGIDALLSATALEKLSFRANPRTGKLEKVGLYLP